MSAHTELMRKIIDEINGVAKEAKPSVTPPGTTGKGVNLMETTITEAPKGHLWAVCYSYKAENGRDQNSCIARVNAPSSDHAKRYVTRDAEKKGRKEVAITRATSLADKK